ncbi:GNAT family N-acetyltransferase [Caulobacter sp. SLTY]|uniref:GNAT family N-acetyltransferase n=1 Tax=Caulobacter sp. SLTY TaxID=2683262 RepID=UPI001412DB25|nr:GNAT family protein [Caulobacter sp. SLTY]NBB15957.1 GNAT family N-acetyltransferase [Caulobacter sp. SLTY]
MALIDWTGLDSAFRLDGGTVRLRPPKSSDYAEWAAVRTASRDFLQPWEPTWARDDLTRAAFRRRLDAWRRDLDAGVTYPFFVFSQDTGALTGGITLSNVRRGVAQTGTVGYWSGVHTARQGHTLAAVRTVTRFAFRTLGLSRLEAACVPGNEASATLLLKAGFQEEGFARAYLKINGEWRDHRLFGLISREREQA